MLFSIYYRIQNRDLYFRNFFSKYKLKIDESLHNEMEENLYELQELIIKMILDEDVENLNLLLSKQNSKVARIFFDHFTNSNVKKMKKENIRICLEQIFKGDDVMKDLKSYLEEKVKPIDLSTIKFEKFKLNEADDAGADDAGGDMGGDDGGDPFADDGGDPFADDGPSGDSNNDSSNDSEESEEGEGDGEEKDEDIDFDGHEDDPDFNKGKSSDDITLSDVPAGDCIYDVEGVMKSLESVLSTLEDYQLAEYKKVKNAITLIFNGKKLNPEDVTFDNPKNASYLIKKVAKDLDEKTKNYLLLKIKTPLISLRDKNKEELANVKKDVNSVRDTLDKLN